MKRSSESAARRSSENAAMERREAPAHRQRCAAYGRLVRRPALHPLGICRAGKLEDGLPGAAKNTGDGACLSARPKQARPARCPRQIARTLPGAPSAQSSALRFHFASLAAAS